MSIPVVRTPHGTLAKEAAEWSDGTRTPAGWVFAPEAIPNLRGSIEEEEKVMLFDLDGTMADFDGSMEAGMRKIATPEEIANNTYYPREQETEPDHIKERRRLIKRQPGFWRDLARLPVGFALLEMAIEIGFHIDVLTKAPRTNFPAWSEKVEWSHKNLPISPKFTVNLVEKKQRFYGRVLADDYPSYIAAWLSRRPRGYVIMPAQPWNADFQHPQVLRVGMDIEYVVGGKAMRSLDMARSVLEYQFNR